MFAGFRDKGILKRQYLQPGNTKETCIFAEQKKLSLEVCKIIFGKSSPVCLDAFRLTCLHQILASDKNHGASALISCSQIGENIGSWAGWLDGCMVRLE